MIGIGGHYTILCFSESPWSKSLFLVHLKALDKGLEAGRDDANVKTAPNTAIAPVDPCPGASFGQGETIEEDVPSGGKEISDEAATIGDVWLVALNPPLSCP